MCAGECEYHFLLCPLLCSLPGNTRPEQLGRPGQAASSEHREEPGAGGGGHGGEAVQGPGVHSEEDGIDGAHGVHRVREAAHQGLEAIL